MLTPRAPITALPTHEVFNQPPPLQDFDLFETDAVLGEALHREGGGWASDRCRALGTVCGRADVIALGHDANRHPPELRTHDRYGQRIDEVEFHPAYHRLMDIAVEHRLPTIAWTSEQQGGHVVHTALNYLFSQIEQGVQCPMTMSYAVVPVLREEPELAERWLPKLFDGRYDPRCLPVEDKHGVTFGMAMTEKQGGSDVRANTTRARPIGASGRGEPYLLNGHKWFCSAPMSDAFLTLAHTERGLSCFFVPRWRPDGTRNPFYIQRLKDKLGNRSNASSEIEYLDTFGVLVGSEGRGVRTIIEMVHHTRLDTAMAPAAIMRQALLQAVHHCRHRSAFGKRLIEQPLMRNVLADLTLEWEAAVVLVMRVARAFDESATDERAARFARIATALAKYWLNKRLPEFVYESLECLGGAGYVEESIMPRLYREAPLNSIWEGSGNVICLDVLRAIHREPGTFDAWFDEVGPVVSREPSMRPHLDRVLAMLGQPDDIERQARRLAESMAKLLQASLVLRHSPTAIADTFCATRLGDSAGEAYGTLPANAPLDAILARVDRALIGTP